MKLSFIFATNRNPCIYGLEAAKNINSVFAAFDREIVICSPDRIFGPNIVCVDEPPGNQGCQRALNAAYRASTGDFVFLTADDHHYETSAVAAVDWLTSADKYEGRKFKILGIRGWTGSPCPLPPYVEPQGFNVAPFPVIARDTVDRYMGGVVFHPSFIHHFADNWIGYWFGMEGEPVIECSETKMLLCDNHSTIFDHDTHDEEVFKELIHQYEAGVCKRYF